MSEAKRHVFHVKSVDKNAEYTVLIPAAGIGQRMKSYGPKALIEIQHSTIIERQIELCKQSIPKCKFVVVGGFQYDKLCEVLPKGVVSVENVDYEDTNVAHSIRLGINHVNTDKLIVMMGDLVFDTNTLKELPFNSHSALTISHHMDDREVGCVVSKKKVHQVFYGLDNPWAQIAYFTGKEMATLRHIIKDSKFDKAYFFEAINCIIQRGGTFNAHLLDSKYKIFDIDTSKDINKIKDIK